MSKEEDNAQHERNLQSLKSARNYVRPRMSTWSLGFQSGSDKSFYRPNWPYLRLEDWACHSFRRLFLSWLRNRGFQALDSKLGHYWPLNVLKQPIANKSAPTAQIFVKGQETRVFSNHMRP
jgi:hypothetical protein